MDRIYTALPVNRALISRIRIIARSSDPLRCASSTTRVEREQDGGGGGGGREERRGGYFISDNFGRVANVRARETAIILMREKRGARDVENCRSDFAMSFTILVRPSLAQPSRRGLNVSRRNFFLTFIKREYRLDDWPAGRPADRPRERRGESTNCAFFFTEIY